jgi:putative toxin-antitoxin system antitoxin component (TIGR02293 family)
LLQITAPGLTVRFAVEVFEDKNSATSWLNSPQFGLGGSIPVHHMRTAKGVEDVENLLGRIEYGRCRNGFT